MDLFTCSSCGAVFYSTGASGGCCLRCGTRVDHSASHLTSIPLAARCLDGDRPNTDPAPQRVMLRRKNGGETAERIARSLRIYFELTNVGSSIEILVDPEAVGPPTLRVAAILDGIDRRWEEHFHLPVPLGT